MDLNTLYFINKFETIPSYEMEINAQYITLTHFRDYYSHKWEHYCNIHKVHYIVSTGICIKVEDL
jgi:hypothetical protein